MEKESGIMNKLKKDKKITYKMILVCLSLVMMITSFLPMTVQAADKNEIINSLSVFQQYWKIKIRRHSAVARFIIEKLVLILRMERTQVIIRKHCRHHFKMTNIR